MGVHYTQTIRWYQIVLVLGAGFLMVGLMNDFNWMQTLIQFAVLLGVILIFSGLTFATLYILSKLSGNEGLKDGTEVTDDRTKKVH